ncbi:MAG: DUF3160 domain-containing protein [Bacillota bacterium]
MFDETGKKEEKGIQSTGGNNFLDPGMPINDGLDEKKRKLLILGTIFVLIVVAVLFWILFHALRSPKNDQPEDASASTTDPARLGDAHLEGGPGDKGNENGGSAIENVEYLSFADFYREPATPIPSAFASFDLPLNVKADVSNYYDISRKIDLEKSLTALNSNGFAVVNNPWEKQSSNFYSLAQTLSDNGVPLYISADFLSYYYQGALKASFKDIEEGVFFDSLWQISKSLFDSSRARYEARVAEAPVGNDPILEGERLETAFFAVALELLKPQPSQVDEQNKFAAGKFSPQEKEKLAFNVPGYLNDDVVKELELIRAAQDRRISPVLLYDRDYKQFVVPSEYRSNAKLNNFYLAAAWLNSIFPLNYRADSCKDCLLDKDDWRINITAAALIAQDFSKNQELKDEWARVYKTMAFFKGLRDSWDYVDYRDASKNLFGEEYDIASVFGTEKGDEERERLRNLLLERQPSPMQGGNSLKTMDGYQNAGFQFLADFYWPNEFIFGRLSYPATGILQGKLTEGNVTSCLYDRKYQRCQGSGQDILKILNPAWESEAYAINAGYEKYGEALTNLRPEAEAAMGSQVNNYWSSLFLWNTYLDSSADSLPANLRTEAWRERMAQSAMGGWIDLQVPEDKLAVRKEDATGGLSASSGNAEYASVEPQVAFYDRMLAHGNMVMGMFQALGLDLRSSLAANRLRETLWQIAGLKAIAEKQAAGQAISAEDIQFVKNFIRLQTVESEGEKLILLRNGFLGMAIKEQMLSPGIIVVANKVGDEIVFSAGPIYRFKESK